MAGYDFSAHMEIDKDANEITGGGNDAGTLMMGLYAILNGTCCSKEDETETRKCILSETTYKELQDLYNLMLAVTRTRQLVDEEENARTAEVPEMRADDVLRGRIRVYMVLLDMLYMADGGEGQ